LFDTEFFTEEEQWYKNSETIKVIPESPDHIVIDAICTLYYKYYKNCVKGCPKIDKDGLLDINKKGTCIHLNESRKKIISKKDDYYIIGASRFGDVKYLKYNSSNYNSDFLKD